MKLSKEGHKLEILLSFRAFCAVVSALLVCCDALLGMGQYLY